MCTYSYITNNSFVKKKLKKIYIINIYTAAVPRDQDFFVLDAVYPTTYNLKPSFRLV